mmetsp:Transcript_31622/g.59091  ORF Transcript_31622/g.59091 Transcript_31622/m.59091 type:complete len:264 (+) Transcript_31622:83-874(+)
MARAACSAYRQLLQDHPLKTKALTSSVITALSDVGLQLYEQYSSMQMSSKAGHIAPTGSLAAEVQLNWSRTSTLAAVGLFYSGPVNHLWFASLEQLVRVRHRVGQVGIKLFLDQVVFVPSVISGYMTVRGLFEGRSLVDISTQLQLRLKECTLAAYQYWPFVNALSFSVVPVMYRVLFGNVAALFWNARLSAMSTKSSGDAGAASDAKDKPLCLEDVRVHLRGTPMITQWRCNFELSFPCWGVKTPWDWEYSFLPPTLCCALA